MLCPVTGPKVALIPSYKGSKCTVMKSDLSKKIPKTVKNSNRLESRYKENAGIEISSQMYSRQALASIYVSVVRIL